MKRSALPGCVHVNETPRHRAAEGGSDDRNPLTDPSCLEWLDVRRARDVALVRRPADAYAIHLHHIDPGFGPIRDEILTRWQQGAYAPALGADIAAVPGKDASTAQRIDQESYPGQTPVTSYVARTAFLHTLAHGEAAPGHRGTPVLRVLRDYFVCGGRGPAGRSELRKVLLLRNGAGMRWRGSRPAATWAMPPLRAWSFLCAVWTRRSGAELDCIIHTPHPFFGQVE